MPDEPKKNRITLAFDVIDGAGVDTSTLMMCVDGKAVGYLDAVNFDFKAKERWGRLQYTQFRNPRETGKPEDCGIWDIHTFGDNEETND